MIMPFTADELTSLPDVISAPRFATYLQVCGGQVEEALALYAWNAEVAAAFMVPLHICEVAVRNAAEEAIAAVHGANWPWVPGFARSLPKPKRAWDYDAGKNLLATAKSQPTVGKVVSELNFAFWEKVFTAGQDTRIWDHQLSNVLPGLPQGMTTAQARGQIHSDLTNIRRFRNRIAHHEPVFARDLPRDFARIRELIAWRRPHAALWLDKVERVSEVIVTRPVARRPSS